jgi:hypothetical protein
VAGRVGDDADRDRNRDSGGDDRRQDPHLAPRALLVRHWRILLLRHAHCNPYFAAYLAG